MPIALIVLLASIAILMALPVPAQIVVGILGVVLVWFGIDKIRKGRAEKERQRRIYEETLREFRWDDRMSPIEFERHCADYLALRGWNARTTAGSGDQGADVIADKSGVKIVLQCKKYSKTVGNKAVQEALAARHFTNAHQAAVVSNSSYTRGATELSQKTGVHLLHFTDLARADLIFGVGRGAAR